jgi:hypothetical protein
MLQRIYERVRRLELQAEVPPSHYEPGAAPTGQPPTTGANAGKTEMRGEDEVAAGGERSETGAEAVSL